MHETEETIATDRLVGAEAIAAFRGEPVRRTRHLIERQQIPHGREGGLIVASKRALMEDWRKKTGGQPEVA